MTITKNDILFWTAIITAVWFAFTGMAWAYWAALVVAYPAGLLSLLIWLKIRTGNRRRTKFIPAILLVGFILSVSVLTWLLIFD